MLNSQTFDVKTRTYLIVLLVFLGLMAGMAAHAQESIRSFQTTIQINEDASIFVTDRIEYEFGEEIQHSIQRTIPIQFSTSTGEQEAVDFSVSNVLRNGRSESYEIIRSGGEQKISIGNPTDRVSGLQTYVIEYRVENAIDFFDDHDELYWNVTGADIEMPVEDVSVEVIFPEPVSEDALRTQCYSDPNAPAAHCVDFTFGTTSISAEAERLAAGSAGLTVIVEFPKGVVGQSSQHNKISQWISANYILIFSGVTLLILLYFWFTRKRDSRGEVRTPQQRQSGELPPQKSNNVAEEGDSKRSSDDGREVQQ